MTKIIFTHEVRSDKRFANTEKLAAASGKVVAADRSLKDAERKLARHVFQKPTNFTVEISLYQLFGRDNCTLFDLNDFAEKYNVDAHEMQFTGVDYVELTSQLFAEQRALEAFNGHKKYLTDEVQRHKSYYESASKELNTVREETSSNGMLDVSYIAQSARNIKKILVSASIKSDVFSNENEVVIVLFEKCDEIRIPDFGINIRIATESN